MNNANPGKSPKLAAEDLQDIQHMLEGLAALTKSLGRSLPANQRSYTAEDLQARAQRVGQIAAYILEQGKPAAAPKGSKKAATPPGQSKRAQGKKLLEALTGADKDFVDGLDSNSRGSAGVVLRSTLRNEVWPLVVAGDVDLALAFKVCQVEEEKATGESWAVLVEQFTAKGAEKQEVEA